MKIKEEKKENVFEKNVNDFFNLIFINYFNQQLHKDKNILEDNINVPRELEMDLHEYSGFFFGMASDQTKYVGKPADKDGHILVTGFPGSGKTMGLVIPTMKTWRGFQIILDVKGDLYNYWKLLNQHSGKKIKVFRPDAYNGSCCRYDPFAFLRHDGENNLAGNARDLALALIPLMPSVKDPIWIEAVQVFLTGVILYYFDLNFSFFDTMVQIQKSTITKIIEQVKKSENETAKLILSKLSEVEAKVIGNTGMELSKLTPLVTDLAIFNAFSPDKDCDLLDWFDLNKETEPFDIILEIPEANFERWEPMTLLMLNQLIKSLEQRPARTYNKDELPPILIMLDEFPRLGKISAIKNGLSTLRSRGVTFALFAQSLVNLSETYGSDTAKVILDLCSYQVILGVSDPTSQEYFSRAIGNVKSTQKGSSFNFDPFSGIFTGFGININETREPIIYPHEHLTLKDILVRNPYNGICRVDKVLFYEHKAMFMKTFFLQNQCKKISVLTLVPAINDEGGGNYD